MNFIEALSVLSKSSSFAVSTESDRDEGLSRIKSNLYVAMPIEEDLMSLLVKINEKSKKVIFLCGSSGDGKSELMLRAKQKFTQHYIHFHLDATHSFEPHDNAIVTLDRIFDEFEQGGHSLVIGINIGMLGNYSEEAKNKNIRDKIKKYLELKEKSDDFNFVNFEDYPKFEITEASYKSDFITRLLKRITSPSSELYQLYIKEECDGLNSADYLKFINYKLLCNEKVQEVIIELLLKVRLFRKQFITARTFLDLIYELISQKDYLFNNLFSCTDNEILEKVIEFDPSRLRTKTIDRFVISYELDSLSQEFDIFKQKLKSELMIGCLDNSNSYIRLFYIIKFQDLGNNYHKKFTDDFTESLLSNYLEVYRHHIYYDAVKSRSVLRNFYSKELFNAIRSYINKKAPYLEDDQFLIAEYDEYKVISHLKLSPDFSALEKKPPKNSKGHFDVYIRIKDFFENGSDPTLEFSVDINLYELLSRLRAGYRPSKNDRSVVVMLNEIVNRLLTFANKSNQINFKSSSEEVKFMREDNCIEVGY
ncbi:DNA phosphorothioation-dependent restriction protein DptF [Acinetobacter piscicola]|uniref:DNA phosphorothioation-dependent restriction protein DptF n=1 Tax=Acinetobacter piscicola TaxID=2006115 RepID=UPI00101EF218|nr:DNA phosphorothioation-dependent restriction protein DptF [Acinetobacter piscicola]RYL29660.1 DNA phosphorothioation-dependent restriction protein DptF [Acinetobacter piscicola]